MKPYILIVEDHSILYEGLYDLLEKNYFTPSVYIKSYDQAITEINKKRPDLVLLDINLQGDKNGLDLGKILNEKYKIPFIYLTELDDERLFHEGLKTNHEQFIVKAKPFLDQSQLIRSILTCLNKVKTSHEKEGILVYIDYIDKAKNEYSMNTITQMTLKYEDIVLFSSSFKTLNEGKNGDIKKNYCQVLTESGKIFFVKYSLKDLLAIIPYYFVRISESVIVNIRPEKLIGRINGSKIHINGINLKISDTYLMEFNQRLEVFYNSPKK